MDIWRMVTLSMRAFIHCYLQEGCRVSYTDLVFSPIRQCRLGSGRECRECWKTWNSPSRDGDSHFTSNPKIPTGSCSGMEDHAPDASHRECAHSRSRQMPFGATTLTGASWDKPLALLSLSCLDHTVKPKEQCVVGGERFIIGIIFVNTGSSGTEGERHFPRVTQRT